MYQVPQLTTKENRFLEELTLAYEQAGKPLSPKTLRATAQSLSAQIDCGVADVKGLFLRTKTIADIPTLKVLTQAWDEIRKSKITPKNEYAEYVKIQKLRAKAENFQRLQRFCHENGLWREFLDGTRKKNGEWADKAALESVIALAKARGLKFKEFTPPTEEMLKPVSSEEITQFLRNARLNA